ncbi:MAG: carboxylating nicotinate-nucleotide diphosphorylase [Chitinophagaceae bacterium]
MVAYNDQLEKLIGAALAEDIGEGDHSTLAVIPAESRGMAVLKIKQDGVIAGIDVAQAIFNLKEPGTQFRSFKKDGEEMAIGEMAFEVEASIHTILQCERLVLNCMQRMSGIATLTRQYVDAIKGYKTRILDTRKTTPNFRLLEKEAVRLGGGVNHRFGLFDMIMLKDNHIDYSGGIENAILNAWKYAQKEKPGIKIEIETRTVNEVERVMRIGKIDRIMLDNFQPEQIVEALAIIGGKYETEASGGINIANIIQFAQTGVDFVSVGALIHQSQSLDLSLKAVKA